MLGQRKWSVRALLNLQLAIHCDVDRPSYCAGSVRCRKGKHDRWWLETDEAGPDLPQLRL